jgi:hypothetical protein
MPTATHYYSFSAFTSALGIAISQDSGMNELKLIFGGLTMLSIILAVWSDLRVGRIPKEFVTVDYPVPKVAFPFEPLTELATECSNKFAAFPLRTVPKVMLAPAAYFSKKDEAIYHPATDHIYFKDSYANSATPESLADTMTQQLTHAWLWQHRHTLLNGLKIDNRTFTACYDVALAFVGVTKPDNVAGVG